MWVHTKKDRSMSQCITTTNHIVQPSDTNLHGTLFGGTVMGWMDICAAITASKRCAGACVTVCVEKIEFKKPINLGDVVTINAGITEVGTSSMKVGILVHKQKLDGSSMESCLQGEMTFVAVDEDGRPRKIT